MKRTTSIKFLGAIFIFAHTLDVCAFGTLFTSPQQRDSLDQQRTHGQVFKSPPVDTQHSSARSSPTKDMKKVFFNGYVIRKSGPSTTWANQEILPENDHSQQGISLKPGSGKKGTALSVQSPSTTPVQLLPGQTLNLENGQITERYYRHSNSAVHPEESDQQSLEQE
jgi:hypothetical protein